jgi:hypothetical protein
MKHTTILIISSKQETTTQYPVDILVTNEFIDLCDDFSLKTSTELIHFDYLIILNKEHINNITMLPLYCDASIIVTNYYQQSNIDHIYYINENDEFLFSKLDKAIHHICYGE